MKHATQKQEASKTKTSTNSTAALYASHSHQATSALSHHNDTATAVPSAGSTAKPQQALTRKVQYSQLTAEQIINAEKGEFSGVNEMAKKRTMGEVNQVWLYTAFDHPHTSCGCFEAVTFYIPEVDGFGVVNRSFKGATVNGLPFSTIADSAAGGRQIDGFHGMSIEYMRSKKFFAADGGWNRVVWVPKEVKERVKEFIPKDVVDKVATEENATNIDALKAFLKGKEPPSRRKMGSRRNSSTSSRSSINRSRKQLKAQ